MDKRHIMKLLRRLTPRQLDYIEHMVEREEARCYRENHNPPREFYELDPTTFEWHKIE